jgi:hypothetical protein
LIEPFSLRERIEYGIIGACVDAVTAGAEAAEGRGGGCTGREAGWLAGKGTGEDRESHPSNVERDRMMAASPDCFMFDPLGVEKRRHQQRTEGYRAVSSRVTVQVDDRADAGVGGPTSQQRLVLRAGSRAANKARSEDLNG